jgi:hypothetical protein
MSIAKVKKVFWLVGMFKEWLRRRYVDDNGLLIYNSLFYVE